MYVFLAHTFALAHLSQVLVVVPYGLPLNREAGYQWQWTAQGNPFVERVKFDLIPCPEVHQGLIPIYSLPDQACVYVDGQDFKGLPKGDND